MKLKAVLRLSRYNYAAEVVGRIPLSPHTVFDIGTGDGRMKGPVELAAARWVGFDLIPQIHGIAKWDLSYPCPLNNEKAHTALLLDVIEHLSNPGLALANIHHALLPGGRLVITTPNPRWGRSRIHALRSGYLQCFTQSDLDFNHHIFPVWPHVLERLLTEAGFEVDEYVTLDGPWPWPSWTPATRVPVRLVHSAACKLIETRDNTACGMSYGVIALKRA